MGQAEFEAFLTADKAAGALKEKGIDVSPKTLVEKARTKKIPSSKVNGRRRFRLSQLLSYYEGQAGEAH